MNLETKIQNEIMIALSSEGHTVWRNETGKYWTGKVIHRDGRTVTLSNAMMLALGLCVGSADLIGIQKDTGKFFAVEVKTMKGRPSKEQVEFIERVNARGGIAGIARCPQDALDLLAK